MNLSILSFLLLLCTSASAQRLTLVEMNCENLFDCRHDEGKNDIEFTPEGEREWTPWRYWRKMNGVGKSLLSCADELPDIVALIEAENDSVMTDLTRRSLLRNAGYEFLMTQSPDLRGLDVALLYLPTSFQPLCYDAIEVTPLKKMRPTRDLFYVRGLAFGGDTIHLFVVHAPSRYGGENETIAHRLLVANRLGKAIDELPAGANIIVTGDFNDYAESPSMKVLMAHGLHNVTKQAVGHNGARGTYRYQGEWRSIDHVLVSSTMVPLVDSAYINDAKFLLQRDQEYGGMKPFRTYNFGRYQRGGLSDHLPLVVRFRKRATLNLP